MTDTKPQPKLELVSDTTDVSLNDQELLALNGALLLHIEDSAKLKPMNIAGQVISGINLDEHQLIINLYRRLAPMFSAAIDRLNKQQLKASNAN